MTLVRTATAGVELSNLSSSVLYKTSDEGLPKAVAAGESLVDIIVQIADMIQYKMYNLKSPLNTEAAEWAKKNQRMFPLGNVNIMQPQAEVDISNKRPVKCVPGVPMDDLEIVLHPVVKDDLEIELK